LVVFFDRLGSGHDVRDVEVDAGRHLGLIRSADTSLFALGRLLFLSLGLVTLTLSFGKCDISSQNTS